MTTQNQDATDSQNLGGRPRKVPKGTEMYRSTFQLPLSIQPGLREFFEKLCRTNPSEFFTVMANNPDEFAKLLEPAFSKHVPARPAKKPSKVDATLERLKGRLTPDEIKALTQKLNSEGGAQ